MRTARACLALAGLLLMLSCSSAPPKNDTVTTMVMQADQDSAYGDAYLKQGRYQLALQFFTQSLSEYTSIDNTDGIIKSYNAIGLTYVTMGSLDLAEDILLRARSRGAEASPTLAFTTLLNLGELYLARGDARKSMEVLREAEAMPATARTEAQSAVLLHDMGTAQRDLGDSAGALESYGKSLKINLDRKLIEMAASDYYMIASVHSRDGRYEEAIRSAQSALALDKQIESSPGIAKDLYALGLIAVKQKDMNAAYDYFQRSYLVSTTLNLRSEMRKALTGLIGAAEALNRTADLDTYRTALADLGSS